MFPSIGVDLLHLPRLTSLLFSRRTPYLRRFAARILTPRELSQFDQRHTNTSQPSAEVVRWLGVRWAAKEAAFKAGGPDRRLLWKQVEVDYLSSGKPYLRLLSQVGRAEKDERGELSISHDGDYVVAMAMIPGRPELGAWDERRSGEV
ncbi:4'-phosphopantetheinyl transferase [Geopyxis carbonaria]|nr:4'-phosphopantetheinyl transferase [Geopyxis carbonaria]